MLKLNFSKLINMGFQMSLKIKKIQNTSGNYYGETYLNRPHGNGIKLFENEGKYIG